jgi:Serine/threonine protein kinase
VASRKKIYVQSPLAKYELGEIVGEGGGGRVYRAASDNGDTVAVKVLDPTFAKSAKAQRFKNEVSFGSKVHHPNVMPVLDFGECEIDGSPSLFYVMPFFDLSLRALMKRGIAPGDVIGLFSGLLDALRVSHERGVWHRDVKPENAMFDEPSNSLILSDFGIAHFEEEELWTAVETKAGERLANFQYAAPEQRIRSGGVDHRADIFASGLILNEMFTGTLAYGTGFRRVTDVSPAHGYLDAVVDKMIRTSADHRYQSIQDVVEDIELLSTGTSLLRGRSLGQKAAIAERKKKLFWSEAGVEQAKASADVILSRALAILGRCREDYPELKLKVESAPNELVVRTAHASAQIHWHQPFSNIIDEARVTIWAYRGGMLLPSQRGNSFLITKPVELSETRFYPDLTEDGLCWRDPSGQLLNANQTADAIVDAFWDAVEQCMPSPIEET